jgi:hypothetical protein
MLASLRRFRAIAARVNSNVAPLDVSPIRICLAAPFLDKPRSTKAVQNDIWRRRNPR